MAHPMFFPEERRKPGNGPLPCKTGTAIIASGIACPTIRQHATRCARCTRYLTALAHPDLKLASRADLAHLRAQMRRLEETT